MAIRVLVVDDHTLVREGLVGLLESQPDITVVGQVGSGREALDSIPSTQPTVVLMDITLPGLGGLDTTQEITDRFPDVHVLVVTVHDRDDYLFRALRAGATGYVLKGAEVHDLLAAVRTAHRGEVYLLPSVTKKLVADYLQRSRSDAGRTSYDGLSDREREILSLIAQGMTTNEIAATLILSPHTIQSHRDHIMAKLGLHTKAALIRYALAHGLIEL